MELRSTIKFALIGNVVALAIIYAIEATTSFFGLKYASDYAFMVLMSLWGCATLLYMYPPGSGFGSNLPESRQTEVDEEPEEAEDIDEKRFSANSIVCLKFLMAGIPALIYCGFNQVFN